MIGTFDAFEVLVPFFSSYLLLAKDWLVRPGSFLTFDRCFHSDTTSKPTTPAPSTPNNGLATNPSSLIPLKDLLPKPKASQLEELIAGEMEEELDLDLDF